MNTPLCPGCRQPVELWEHDDVHNAVCMTCNIMGYAGNSPADACRRFNAGERSYQAHADLEILRLTIAAEGALALIDELTQFVATEGALRQIRLLDKRDELLRVLEARP